MSASAIASTRPNPNSGPVNRFSMVVPVGTCSPARLQPCRNGAMEKGCRNGPPIYNWSNVPSGFLSPKYVESLRAPPPITGDLWQRLHPISVYTGPSPSFTPHSLKNRLSPPLNPLASNGAKFGSGPPNPP